jgi:hypothetical protein
MRLLSVVILSVQYVVGEKMRMDDVQLLDGCTFNVFDMELPALI